MPYSPPKPITPIAYHADSPLESFLVSSPDALDPAALGPDEFSPPPPASPPHSLGLESALLDATTGDSPFMSPDHADPSSVASASASGPARSSSRFGVSQSPPSNAERRVRLLSPTGDGPGRTTVSGGSGPQGRAISIVREASAPDAVDAQGPATDEGVAGGGGPAEGLTVGQLKHVVKAAVKEPQTVYDFPTLHAHPPHLDPNHSSTSRPRRRKANSHGNVDTDTLIHELDEFYSYVEVSGVLEGRDAWRTPNHPSSASPFSNNNSNGIGGACRAWPEWLIAKKINPDTPWPSTSEVIRKSYLVHLLDRLEDRDPETRFDAARRVLYVAQGTFAHATCQEHHLRLVIENATLLRSAGGLESVFGALKGVGIRHDWLSSLPEAPDGSIYIGGMGTGVAGATLSAAERGEYLEEINGELAIHLAVLYFMVEVFRGEDAWGEELMSLDPPLPIYMFTLIAGLREKSAKGYPVKKLLLLLWKSMLATLGGMRDVHRLKILVRSIEGLPPVDLKCVPQSFKVSPLDFHTFRSDVMTKYPTYVPPQDAGVGTGGWLDRIAAASGPTPIVRHGYHVAGAVPSDPVANHTVTMPLHHQGQNGPPGVGGMMNGMGGNVQPPNNATPAPTPPGSPQPKPKKQQFQTDQNKPFILPFSIANRSKIGSLVPKSLEEAGELYKNHLRLSTDLWQTWKVREELLADESGVGKAETSSKTTLDEGVLENKLSKLSITTHNSKRESQLNGNGNGSLIDDGSEDFVDSLGMLMDLENRFEAEVVELENIKVQDRDTREKLKQCRIKVQDTKRMQRVELLYRSVLPQLQSAVIVLLKLLLATVTANSQFPTTNETDTDSRPQMTLEDIDITRHREITSKAVSAILILTLKWFKVSHVMKFHYLAQLLVDSNCLLLVLKMFGLQEVSVQIRNRNESEEHNFFRYCALYGSLNPDRNVFTNNNDQHLLSPPNLTEPLPEQGDSSLDEVEIITDYSWRNFFSVINFVHILQKLTKRRVHRILLLVQYKSSAILKRILKANHPTLQLYVLKVIKSQIPFCGRKWRQANMKVITAIYLNCRADLRDEWLLGLDVDSDVEDSLPQEQALRSLVSFYNTKHYAAFAAIMGGHQRHTSFGAPVGDAFNASAGQAWSQDRQQPPSSHPPSSADDVFPPVRPPSMNHNSDGVVEDHEMESFFYPQYSLNSNGALERNDGVASAWNGIGEILGDFDDISDSESIASIGYLGIGGGVGIGGFGFESGSDTSDVSSLDEFEDQQRTDWETISPQTIAALEEDRQAEEDSVATGSPRHLPRRRNSSGPNPKSPALRPVLVTNPDDDDDDDEDDNNGRGQGPIDDDGLPRSPLRSPGGTLRSPRGSMVDPPSPRLHAGAAVDEVEAVWGA